MERVYLREMICNLERFIGETEKSMGQNVEMMLDKPLPVLTEEKFALFETTGNRVVYEREYFAKRRFLALYGVAAVRMKRDGLEMLGKVSREDICKKLEEILMDICEEVCWAIPAHVNRQDGSDWRNTVDLFAAETAEALAYVTDILGDWLGAKCRSLVKENVKRRVLIPFFSNPVGTWNWEQCEHNWNAVCNGCIATAYLHSLEEGEKADPAYIKRICDNLVYFIDGYADDGTCMEGVGYFDYGMTYFTNFAWELYDASNGEVDLLRGDWAKYKAGENDKRGRIATWWCKCFFASGRTVSFSDGNSRGKYRIGLGSALAMRFSEVELPDFAMAGCFEHDHCARFVPYKMDYFFARRYSEQLKKDLLGGEPSDAAGQETVNAEGERSEEAGEFIILDSAQWCIGRAANGIGMACKGGHNDEPHNHNDVGSFLYVAGGEMFLADLGAGEYTKEYFSTGRYNVFCNNSFSHNVPIIAGQGQLVGKEYRCTAFHAVEESDRGTAFMDFAAAYGENPFRDINRRFFFDKKSGRLEIMDVFENQGVDTLVTENLVTQYVPKVEGGEVVISGETGNCRIEISPVPSLRVVEKEHRSHDGKTERVYLIQWDLCVKGRMEVVINISGNA